MRSDKARAIADCNRNLAGPVRLRLLENQAPQSELLREFCRTLCQQAPQLKLEMVTEPDAPFPAIFIPPGLRYLAVPEGPEFGPFLDALQLAAAPEAPGRAEAVQALSDLKTPADLKIFITPGCPHCPHTVQTLLPLAFVSDRVQVWVIDGSLFPELARTHGVQSAPTVLLDDRFRWTGAVSFSELLQMVKKRDPAHLSAKALEGLIQAGKAGEVAEMMGSARQVFPAFLTLLTHEKWPTRLGAMVAAEGLMESAPQLADQGLVKPLVQRFDQLSEPVQGDILYLLGRSGNPKVAAFLEKVRQQSQSPELKEAAAEALEAMRQGSQ